MTDVAPESGLFAAVNENDKLAGRSVDARGPRTAHSQEIEEEEGCEGTVAWNLTRVICRRCIFRCAQVKVDNQFGSLD
jgi:hypothetical protein